MLENINIAKTTKKRYKFVKEIWGHSNPGVLKQRKADNAHKASEVVGLLGGYGHAHW